MRRNWWLAALYVVAIVLDVRMAIVVSPWWWLVVAAVCISGGLAFGSEG